MVVFLFIFGWLWKASNSMNKWVLDVNRVIRLLVSSVSPSKKLVFPNVADVSLYNIRIKKYDNILSEKKKKYDNIIK